MHCLLIRSTIRPRGVSQRLRRTGALLLVAAVVALTVAQQWGTVGPWWLELSRYLPYPVLWFPVAGALALTYRLGWRWVLLSLGAGLLVATVTMGLVWHTGGPGPHREGTALRMMTYNIKAYKAVHREDGFSELAQEVAYQHPDILVMQDANWWPDPRAETTYWTAPVFGLPYAYAVGQYVIASRFALERCDTGHMDYRNEKQRYAHCVVKLPGHDVTLVTAHFESPRSGLNAARREGIDGVAEWRRNYEDRYVQATELARDLGASARPLLIAGDLNAPESSSVIRTLLALGLRDAFSAGGRGYGYSYGQGLKLGFSFLRIDHILVSPEFTVTHCYAGGGEASDHRPVIADLFLPG